MLTVLLSQALSTGARVIGRCVGGDPGMIVARTVIGGTRVVLDLPLGGRLPRIC